MNLLSPKSFVQSHSDTCTTIMATPQRLFDDSAAPKREADIDVIRAPHHRNPESDPQTPKSSITPIKPPAAATNNKKIDAHQSPIGKHLPGPMKMAQIITTPKREGYLSWDDYFLGIAVLSSQRSKDPQHAEGACIADASNRIVAIGYSGFPMGCPDTVFPWKDFGDSSQDDSDDEAAQEWLHSKRAYICAAATNAVLNKGSQDLTGCRMYLTNFPKSDCIKVMLQSGIKELIILQKDATQPDYGQNSIIEAGDNSNDLLEKLSSNGATEDELAGGVMLALADIHVRYYRPPISRIVLDFDMEITNPPSPAVAKAPTDRTDEEVMAAYILQQETGYDAFGVGDDNGRRHNYLTWDDYFMSIAFLTAKRSKDPSTIVGACIVDDKRRIVGLGYNGMPMGLSDDIMPWAKHNSNPLFNKYKYVVHAEVNAILNSRGSYSTHLNGGTIYVSLFPCENCTKMIIQSGIKKVVYLKDIYHNTDGCRASRVMMRCANIEFQQYRPTRKQVDVEFYKDEVIAETSAPLPDGWETAVSPVDNRTYFYNPTTGATSWTHPSLPVTNPEPTPPDVPSNHDKAGE